MFTQWKGGGALDLLLVPQSVSVAVPESHSLSVTASFSSPNKAKTKYRISTFSLQLSFLRLRFLNHMGVIHLRAAKDALLHHKSYVSYCFDVFTPRLLQEDLRYSSGK